MRSHLTRRVFQQILRNEPFTHTQCCRLTPHNPHRLRNASHLLSRPQTRSIWQFFPGFKKRVIKPEDFDPGIEDLTENANRVKMGVQPLSIKALSRAFETFFDSKEADKDMKVLDTQMQALVVAAKMLRAQGKGKKSRLSGKSINSALAVLHPVEGNKSPLMVELAEILYQERKKQVSISQDESFGEITGEKSEVEDANMKSDFLQNTLRRYIRLLGILSEGSKAKEELKSLLNMGIRDTVTDPQIWAHVLKGCADDQEGVKSTRDFMQEHDIPFDEDCCNSLLRVYIDRKDIGKAKEMFDLLQERFNTDLALHRSERSKVLAVRLCMELGEMDWGQQVVKSLVRPDMSKRGWNTILQWTAAQGKGVDEIERMMTIWKREVKRDNQLPDISTINSLIEGANLRNDAYSAERYLELGARWGIPLDAQTRVLQMDYRLKVDDLDGARAAYKALKTHEVPTGGEDIPVINRMIVYLCSLPSASTSNTQYDEIMDYVLDLTDRKATLTPPAIASLATLHFSRAEFDDATDLLNTYASHLSSSSRTVVRDKLLSFVLSPTHAISLSWGTYTILKNRFPELPLSARIQVMTHFFASSRVDMAVHTFGHMRQTSPHLNLRPTAAAYTACFTGLARARDLSSLHVVHNMLRLDAGVEPDTTLRNSLMLAYMGCDEPSFSLDHWQDICASREGPSYESICIALMACQRAAEGLEVARGIWERMKRLEVEVTGEVGLSYAAALAARGEVEGVWEVLGEDWKGKEEGRGIAGTGVDVDAFTIAAIHNACQFQKNLDAIVAWAKREYPDEWARLEKVGRDKNGRFKVRDLDTKPPADSTFWQWAEIAADEHDDSEGWDHEFDELEKEYKEGKIPDIEDVKKGGKGRVESW